MQPQMAINKTLIKLIRAIASCRASLYLGPCVSPGASTTLLGSPPPQTSHLPTAYSKAPNYASVCP